MRLSEAVKEFLLACEADGLSKSSLNWYRTIIGQFAAVYDGSQVKEITATDVRRYLVGLKEGYSEDSRGSYTRALHRFWKWAEVEADWNEEGEF